MSALLFALALFAAQPTEATPATEAPAADAPPAEDALPAGAPKDDYQFVAWCYGDLRAYLDLHDKVMPDVTRIESTYRPPNRKLSDDMKVYADMQKDGRRQLKVFQEAMTAAEKASLRPINADGAEAVRHGRSVWNAPEGTSTARIAQEWMSWTLPARCEATAKTLEARSKLMGASLKANDEPEPAAAEAPAPTETPAPSPN
jgi:hypothetical protein